ncbi:MAG: PLP-dependent aminotransferase family protein, partial [Anaerolineae bacterium]|nr:PLP-dependent aminotransferase family protein [Anaerolineae bacterium]
IWVTLPAPLAAREMDAAVRPHGVDYLPGAACFFDGSGKNTLRLAFSYAPEDKLATGIQAIAECVRERLAG